jgi:hypothetical protein
VDLELKVGGESVMKIAVSLGEVQMMGRKETDSDAERPK